MNLSVKQKQTHRCRNRLLVAKGHGGGGGTGWVNDSCWEYAKDLDLTFSFCLEKSFLGMTFLVTDFINFFAFK